MEIITTYQFSCSHEHCTWDSEELNEEELTDVWRRNGAAPDDQHFLDTGHDKFTMTKKQITPSVIVEPMVVRDRLLKRRQSDRKTN